MTLQVLAPGLLTTVQDGGRHGYQHLGVGPGGAMDPLAHRLANALVGNGPGEATLEITLAGPVLVFGEETLVALCGADLSATVDDRPLPLWRPVWVRAGARLAFGAPRAGARAYLALAGGLPLPLVLGSRSTHLAAGFGGFQGRALRAGDLLPVPPQPRRCEGLLAALRRGAEPFAAPAWFAHGFQGEDRTLPFIPGPQWEELTPASRTAFLEGTYRVAPASNRMGLRLQGPALALARNRERLSAPVAAGTLQLPPDGAPILLMADRQTTGGYPRLGELASVALPAAAQLRSPDPVRFVPVTAEAARAALLVRERQVAALTATIQNHLEGPE